jgi:hypothetical protein
MLLPALIAAAQEIEIKGVFRRPARACARKLKKSRRGCLAATQTRSDTSPSQAART